MKRDATGLGETPETESEDGGPAWLAGPLGSSELVWAAGSLAAVHRIPFDPQLLLAEFAPPYTCAALVRALGALGLAVTAHHATAHELGKHALPCLTLLRAAIVSGNSKIPS